MASRNAQTWAKRAREQAVKERRDRKRAKRAEVAAARAAGHEAPPSDSVGGEEDAPTPTAPEPTPAPQE
jgi:hypothetical protein